MASQHNKQWLGFRVFFGCVLGLVVLSISASGEASRLFNTGTRLPAYIQQGPDLCALLKGLIGNERVNMVPGVGDPDAVNYCKVLSLEKESKFRTIDVNRNGNVQVQRDFVEGRGREPGCVPNGLGDVGYDCGGIILFARGHYVAYLGGGGDLGTGRSIANGLASALPSASDAAGPTETPVPAATAAAATAVAATATPTPNLDLTIHHIEVVQVVQDEQNNAQIYAGKETLVRVFVGVNGATTTVPGVEVELRAYPVGNDVGIVIPARNSPFTAPLNPSRAALTDTVNFDLPADLITSGTYPIKVTINPNKTISETTYDNNALTRQMIFVEPFNMRIGYVRIGYTPPGSANVVWPAGPLQTYTSTLVNIYPTNGTALQYYEFPNRLVYPGPLTGIANKVALRDWLRRRYDRLRSLRGEMAPDLVVGYLGWRGPGAGPIPNPAHVFTDAVGIAELGTYEGEKQSMPPPAPVATRRNSVGRVAWVVDYNGVGGVDSSERVLAHEVGHILTLHHPATNDLPTCWGPSVNDFPGYWPRGTGQTWEIGYNHLTRDLVPDNFYDIQNYCPANLTWISPLHYKRLFDSMRRYNLNDPDLMPDLAWDDFLVSGSLARDGSSGRLDPLYRVTSSARSENAPNSISSSSTGAGLHSPLPQQTQGENCLRFTGANGALSEHCFDVSFFEVETGQQLDEVGFSLRLPYPQGVNGVELVRNGKELDKRTASSNAPNLSITSPKAGDSWDGSQSISWTASDPDGDKLTYEVHYSPTGGDDWFPLELGLQDTQYAINTADVAGGDKVFLRVFASDGFNTSRTDVGPIKVPNSPPWEPPARPGSNAPGNPPTNPGSGSGTAGWVLALFGLGVGLLIGVGMVVIVVIMRRSSASQGQGPMGYPPYQQPPYLPPANVPPTYAPPGPRVPPPPPRTPPTPPTPRTPPMSSTPQTPPTPGVSGVPIMPGNPFSSAEKEYARLRGELTAGRSNPQQFEAAVRQMRVTDAQGRTWMLSPQTGQWLMYDGRGWVPGRPM